VKDSSVHRISWITADYFIDVDLPIISRLADEYDICWIIVLQKSVKLDYEKLINERIGNKDINIRIVRTAHRSRDPLLAVDYYKILKLAMRNRPDIFYVDIVGMPYFIPLAKFLLPTRKTVCAVHNVSTPLGASKQWLTKFYTRFIIKSFRNIHVFSESQKAELEEYSKNKNILLAPLALKSFGKSNLNPDGIITFLNFGIIREYKRVDVLIKAANEVYEETGLVFKIKICGACSNWEKYSELIKYPFLFDLKIETIPNDEIPDMFATSHYYVLPYQDVAQSGALAVGLNYNLPVIVSDLPAFKEFVQDRETGFVMEIANVNSLKSIMVYILRNHDEIYPGLKKNQKRFVEKRLSLDFIASEYIKYINGIVDEKH
jgi:glycosyltransferase involved in cell wall biosynthesis